VVAVTRYLISFDEGAMNWAGKFAVACRCAQEVRELMHDSDA
jgi:hypothetical protein